MNINKCLESAVAQGHISREEADHLKKTLAEIRKQVGSDAEAKEAMVHEIEAIAAERKRIAVMMEDFRARNDAEVFGYRNLKGQADPAEAVVLQLENQGHHGSYIRDVKSDYEAIRKKYHAKIEELDYEMRRGAILGDLRRNTASVSAMRKDWVREMFGQSTGNPIAKRMADEVKKILEEMRLRYNQAGGAIGKLEGYGLPQFHNREALLDGNGAPDPREKWIKYLMEDGVLDRDRMVHPLTGRKMTDAELRESLEVSYDRAVSDGMVDKEVTGAPVGRGALWKQRRDHRFIHFKDADQWMKYQELYGARDPYANLVNHINSMARDIAHMEKFGPNPVVMRTYLRNRVLQEALTRKPWQTVLDGQVDEAKKIAAQFTDKVPNAEQIIDQIAEINREMAAGPGMRRRQSPTVQAKLDALTDRAVKLEEAFDVQKFTNGKDQELASVLGKLFDEMRDPIVFKGEPRKAAERAERLLRRADAMYEQQRGSLTPDSIQFANIAQSTRNVISASALGAAVISAISDVAFGSTTRMRMGMGISKTNIPRLLALTLKNMLPNMTRREAARAMLGIDSSLQVLHQRAKEDRSFDHKFITSYLADRNYVLAAAWTQSGKHNVGFDFMGSFADIAEIPHAQLPKELQKVLARHGFDQASWDAVRGAEQYEPKQGVYLLRANEIETHVYNGLKGMMDEEKARVEARKLSQRYLAMILRETTHAVPEVTDRSRSLMMGRTTPGSVLGETLRSMGQFKSFGVAVVQLHMLRISREIMAGDRSAMREAAMLAITGMVLGGVAVALKEVKDGKDPRKWFDENTFLDPAFWGAAILQAGGLGIYGDFLFSNTGRHGGGLKGTVAGPIVDRVDTFREATIGNILKAAKGEKTTAKRDAAKVLRQNAPFSTVPGWSLVWNRVLMDSLQRMVDPEAYRSFNQKNQSEWKDYGRRMWWPHGQSKPSRAPDMSRIISTTR